MCALGVGIIRGGWGGGEGVGGGGGGWINELDFCFLRRNWNFFALFCKKKFEYELCYCVIRVWRVRIWYGSQKDIIFSVCLSMTFLRLSLHWNLNSCIVSFIQDLEVILDKCFHRCLCNVDILKFGWFLIWNVFGINSCCRHLDRNVAVDIYEWRSLIVLKQRK